MGTSKSAIINGIWEIRKNNRGQDLSNMGLKSKEGNLITSKDKINERYKKYYEELLMNRKTKEEYKKHQKVIEENHKIHMEIKTYDHQPINQEITMKELE